MASKTRSGSKSVSRDPEKKLYPGRPIKDLRLTNYLLFLRDKKETHAMKQGPLVPCWTKLSTVDIVTSLEFYTAVFDWFPLKFQFPQTTTSDRNPTQIIYQEGPGAFDFRSLRLSADEPWSAGVAGMYQDRPQRWHCEIRVENLEGYAERIEAAHGQVIAIGGQDIVPVFDFGNLLFFKDLEGADLQLYEPLSMPCNTTIGPNIPSWYELVTADPEGAGHFYNQVLGWTTYQVTDNYWIFRYRDSDVAGMRQLLEGRARWIPYFGVSDLAQSVQKALDAGAVELTVSAFHPAEEVEILQDPLGGELGLIELPS